MTSPHNLISGDFTSLAPSQGFISGAPPPQLHPKASSRETPPPQLHPKASPRETPPS